jgi:hypothetical protein
VQLKKVSTPNAKIAKISEYLLTKTTSARHEDCLIVEKILFYSDSNNDGSIPSLSPKETAEVVISSLKSLHSLSTLMVLYSAW